MRGKTGGADFARRYGGWGLVAGASEGLGRAFALEAARRGLSVVLAARREELLARLGEELQDRFGVKTRAVGVDLSRPEAPGELLRETADIEVGLLVYNAALSPIGDFVETDIEAHQDAPRLNCAAALSLTHSLAARMKKIGRGGMVLVSSLASFQGTALVAHYAATKAYLRVLAEGLWKELRPQGVDVLASCPGLVETPNFRRTSPRPPSWFTPPPLRPEQVAKETLDYLGRGPVFIP